MTILFAIFGLAFAITLIVAFHEFGHFSTAKMAGVGVNEFAIGFGPKIIGFHRGGTDYSFRIIPLGGYVDLVGMEEDPEATEEEKALEFVGKSPLWRITVLFAGSFMNFVLAFLLFILVFGFAGRPEQPLVTLTVASHVFKDTPASAAGILPGDKFLAVDNITVTSWNHFRSLIEERTDKQTKLLITRDGENQEVTITPERMGDPLSTVGKIGVVPAQPAIVGDIPPGSPALSAGFEAGDTIISLDGKPISWLFQVDAAVKTANETGATLAVTLFRQTSEISFEYKPMIGQLAAAPPLMPLIGQINPNSPAEKAGFQMMDEILELDGKSIATWQQMVNYFSRNADKAIQALVRNEAGETRTLTVTPQNIGGKGRIGIFIHTNMLPPMGLVKGTILAWHSTIDVTVQTVNGIKKLFTGAVSKEMVSGPVGIASIVGHQAQQGFSYLLRITALLSINIGLLNLFPIPGLDGSRILFVFLEIIRRRKLTAQVEESIHTVGMVLLILLIIFVTYQDIAKLFN